MDSELSEIEREQGIRALFATLLAHNTATADVRVSTSDDPHGELIDLLVTNPAGWAHWLDLPEHFAAAESMTSALTDADMIRLESHLEAAALFDTLDRVRQARATTRRLAADHVIDLRDPAPVTESAT